MVNTELASLTVNYGQLQPDYSTPFGGAYNLHVPNSVERIQVDVRPVYERCVVTIINLPLVPGAKTVIEIKVEHPLGGFRDYGISVYRARAPGCCFQSGIGAAG